MNSCVVSGRLGRDVEIRYTGGGRAIGNLNVAVDNSYKGSDGEWKKSTCWISAVAWGKLAENVASLKKGALVFVSGRLQENKWTDKEGQERSRIEIVANEVYGLDQLKSEPASPRPRTSSAAPEITDEDIPF